MNKVDFSISVDRSVGAGPMLLVAMLLWAAPKVAADQLHPGCERYAAAAVGQQQQNLELGCGLSGPAWNADHRSHYNWCIHGENYERFAAAEERRRAERLASCRSAATPPGRVQDTACTDYVETAVGQHQENLDRDCGFTGPRWSKDIQSHRNWCMRVSETQRRQEQMARELALQQQCARRMDPGPPVVDGSDVEGPAAGRQQVRYAGPAPEVVEPGKNQYAAIFVPVVMYYLERYYAGTPNQSDTDREIALILNAQPNARMHLERALQRFKALPELTRQSLFDEETLALTSNAALPLDVGAVQQRFNSIVAPLTTSPPASPGPLGARNASKFANPDIPGTEAYQIALSWQDRADDEHGYMIYRAFKPRDNRQQADATIEILDRVGPGVTTYVDVLAKPADQEDQYCYQVASYKRSPVSLSGQQPQLLISERSNIACAPYDPLLALPPPAKDTDGDGLVDPIDECPFVPGKALHGCPDLDDDGIRDTVDQCPTEPADPPSGAYPPKAGCPIRYNLRWLGMKVLNNSISANRPKHFHYNEPRNDSLGAGEEPYLHFGLLNGHHQGIPAYGSTQWCCGEGIDVDNRADFEPDSDISGEQHPAALDTLRQNGLQVFPIHPGVRFAPIDTLGMVMTVTLMERDGTITVYPSADSDAAGAILKVGGSVAGAVGGCMTGAGCLAGVAAAFKGLIDTVFGFMASDPKPVEVADEDDFMGSDVWVITRAEAQQRTSQNGAYAFHFVELPTTQWKLCSYKPCGAGGGRIATMRARLDFCLYREGIPEREIRQRCRPSSMVLPWPMVGSSP
ncbi:MAG: hypothetical protein HND55_12535 [Pseudomonadota bacterium]|nr:MAG: hypothetical protein HND55_12535 [Pseudomonadota bacterium]